MSKPIQREIYHAKHDRSVAGRIGYVGCSRYGANRRRKEHEKFARLGFHRNTAFARALRKHPSAVWTWTVLESGFATDREMFDAEKKWIKQFGTRRAYNLTDGGEGSAGLVVSEEVRERLRGIQLGRKASPETIAKMRVAQARRVYGPEWSEMMRRLALESVQKGTRRGMLGKRRSHEDCARMSAAQKGRPKSEEAKQRMRDSWAKRKASGDLWTPRFKAMIAANFAKGRTPEVRKKVGEILKKKVTK